MKKLTVILCAILAAVCAGTVVSAADLPGNDVTAYGTPSVLSGNPGGSGAPIDVIVDGIRPDQETGTNMDQRDTFGGRTEEFEEAFIMTYEKEIEFTAVEFTEGMHFGDGGWFKDGILKCQVLQGENWVDVSLNNEVNYPNGKTQADFLPSFDTYTFEFEPITGTAIRVGGTATGDGQFFASCSEITVYSTVDPATLTTWADRVEAEKQAAAAEALIVANARAAEGFIEQISTPITTYDNMDDNVGGGTKTLSTINDGVFPVDNGNVPQFDTICNTGRWDPYHNEWIGYEFPATYTVEYVEFYEGGNFFDGGFFANGEIWLEALIDGEWTEVQTTMDPDYPVGEEQDEFLPAYDLYTFTLKTPTACDGIRVSGTAGGSASFISCSEIIVKAQVEAAPEEPAPEEPAAEEPAPEEPAAEEPAADEPKANVDETLDNKAEAPNTFDFGILAAAAAVLSLAGFTAAGGKKRR